MATDMFFQVQKTYFISEIDLVQVRIQGVTRKVRPYFSVDRAHDDIQLLAKKYFKFPFWLIV